MASGARFAVKAHGSELEYAMRGNPALAAWGQDCLRRPQPPSSAPPRPPRPRGGVWSRRSRLRGPAGGRRRRLATAGARAALAALLAEARRDPRNPANAEERLPDQGNAERLARFLQGDQPTVVYFGKLIRNKGVQVLLEALDGVDARAVIVGFGD